MEKERRQERKDEKETLKKIQGDKGKSRKLKLERKVRVGRVAAPLMAEQGRHRAWGTVTWDGPSHVLPHWLKTPACPTVTHHATGFPFPCYQR